MAEPVTSLAWDGPQRLISGVTDGTARVWHLPTPALAAGGPAHRAASGPGGTSLAVGGSQLERAAGVRLAVLSPHLPGTAAGMIEFPAFSPGGKPLAGAGDDGTGKRDVLPWPAGRKTAIVVMVRRGVLW